MQSQGSGGDWEMQDWKQKQSVVRLFEQMNRQKVNKFWASKSLPLKTFAHTWVLYLMPETPEI